MEENLESLSPYPFFWGLPCYLYHLTYDPVHQKLSVPSNYDFIKLSELLWVPGIQTPKPSKIVPSSVFKSQWDFWFLPRGSKIHVLKAELTFHAEKLQQTHEVVFFFLQPYKIERPKRTVFQSVWYSFWSQPEGINAPHKKKLLGLLRQQIQSFDNLLIMILL